MEPSTIFFIVCMIVLIYLVYYSYFFSAGNLLSSVVVGNTKTTIKPPVSEIGSMPATATYSVWINVNDWNVNKGFYKNIISYGTSVYISLAPDTNDVILALKTTSTTPTYTAMTVAKNIPLQTWVHLAFSLEGATLDTYMNGRIVTTNMVGATTYKTPSSGDKIILAGDNAKPTSCSSGGADASTWNSGKTAGCSFASTTTPNPGFSGWVTQFQYAQAGTDPQGIWNIYQQGNGSSMFSNFFGNYGLLIALTNNGVSQNSISI